ncbi:MAG: LOG family protein [Luteolibacter sp.]
MPKVRFSGTILGPDDPNRAMRAHLMQLLYAGGWDIYNANGDQRITLANIEGKIIESDAFVFTPSATLEDMFKAVSIFVGYQTLDENLTGKPTAILNTDGSWDRLFQVLGWLHQMGTISQKYEEFLVSVDSPEILLDALAKLRAQGIPDAGRERHHQLAGVAEYENPPPAELLGNVCVFCSATLETPAYLADGVAFGAELAHNQFGCVSGAGKTGIMGAVVAGTASAGGWSGGSNVPHIIELEGLPEGLSSFWLRPDIYTRMEVMIERSDAFVIFPGGAGTLQEFLALMIFKHHGHPLMKNKPVVIYNRLDESKGERFWDPLIHHFNGLCTDCDFTVADTLDEILPLVRKGLGHAQ